MHPPGRPIMASKNIVTSGFFLYIDFFLQPLAQNLQSYIQDSTHLMALLSPYTWIDSYCWLSLYSSIPHHIVMLAIQQFLLLDPMLNSKQSSFILDATLFCLMQNYFHVEGDFYLQIHCTAWVKILPYHMPTWPCFFLENQSIWKNNPFAKHLVFYDRYIDNIIIIWDSPPSLIDDFVAHCNSNELGLPFTSVWNKESLAFLDLELNHEHNKVFAHNYLSPILGYLVSAFWQLLPPSVGKKCTHRKIL